MHIPNIPNIPKIPAGLKLPGQQSSEDNSGEQNVKSPGLGKSKTLVRRKSTLRTSGIFTQ